MEQQNTEILQEIKDIIDNNQKFGIITHLAPDGDTLCTGLALYHILKHLGKDVVLTNPSDELCVIDYFEGATEFQHTNSVDFSDLVVFSVDCPVKWFLGKPINLDKAKILINIDHHVSNGMYGDINFIMPLAVCAGIPVYNLGKFMNVPVTDAIAKCVMGAIISDSGSFRYSKTNSEVFEVAAELTRNNVINVTEISDCLFNTKSHSALLLAGEVLHNSVEEGKILYAWVTKEMMRKFNLEDKDPKYLVAFFSEIRDAEVFALFSELRPDYVKVDLRSKKVFNVNQFASQYGGGGHFNAGACRLEGNIHQVMKDIVGKIHNQLQPLLDNPEKAEEAYCDL